MKSLKTCRINVMVSNMDNAIVFYQDTLGLQLLNRYGNHYAEIQAPDLLIGLHPASKKTIKVNNIAIGLGVVEFDATVKTLESKGITFKPEDEGWVCLAYFSDPDGNPLFLAERKE